MKWITNAINKFKAIQAVRKAAKKVMNKKGEIFKEWYDSKKNENSKPTHDKKQNIDEIKNQLREVDFRILHENYTLLRTVFNGLHN